MKETNASINLAVFAINTMLFVVLINLWAIIHRLDQIILLLESVK